MEYLLVLTAESLNPSHGTGVFVSNLIRPLPRGQVFNLCRLPLHVPTPFPCLYLEKITHRRGQKKKNASTPRRVWRRLLRGGFPAVRHGFRPMQRFKNQVELDDLLSHPPRAVLACPVSETDLDMLALVLEQLPRRVPVLVYFLDWMPVTESRMLRNLQALSPRLAEIWCHSPTLSALLQENLSRPVASHDCVAIDLPTLRKTHYHPCRPGFRSLMIGNVWQKEMFPFLGSVWAACRTLLPQLDRLQWFCHPFRWEQYRGHPTLGMDFLQWAGFLPEEQFINTCSAFDLAIVPLWLPHQEIDFYAAHSIPSRLALLAALGLPIILLAHPDSYAAGYCRRHNLGLVCSDTDPGQAAQRIAGWIRHPSLLAETGARARAFALQHADITPLRQTLFQALHWPPPREATL